MIDNKIITIGGFPVQNMNRKDLAIRLLSAIQNNKKIVLFFANTNFIVKCQFVLEKNMSPQLVLVNDGVGMDIAAKLFYGESFKENLNGTDFTPFLFSMSSLPLRIFMLGGKPTVLKMAVHHVVHVLGQEVVGYCDGYQEFADKKGLIRKIHVARPDIILVAMGNPMQEEWIIQNCEAIDAKLFVGVGALFDFWSGGKSRAPDLFRKIRLEWLYRLFLEPRRLFRRYTLDIIIFLYKCLKSKK